MALVDGEHYPPTSRWGLATARAEGYDVVSALFLGGTEKVSSKGEIDLGGLPVDAMEGDLRHSLESIIERRRPDAILDLSDEPVLGYGERMIVAAVALSRGVRYVGADFAFEPPVEGPALELPTMAVYGTGKRTGKTAIAGEAARALAAAGMEPVVVAMGRGGPDVPVVAEAGSVTLEHLVELARRGQHAASDYLEDALTTGVTTVGARRCAGGLAGRPFVSNVRAAAEIAARMGRVLLLEGSGAAVPPVPWHSGVLVCRADTAEETLMGYLGPYRLLLSDLVVLTMGRTPNGVSLATLAPLVRRLRPEARLVLTDFNPTPLEDVEGKKVMFATTAPPEAGPALVSRLEEASGCDVVARTHALSDRAALATELDAAPAFEVLVTELKAAAVDVAAERARARGAEVVFADNRPETLEGDGELTDLLVETAGLAVDRAAEG